MRDPSTLYLYVATGGWFAVAMIAWLVTWRWPSRPRPRAKSPRSPSRSSRPRSKAVPASSPALRDALTLQEIWLFAGGVTAALTLLIASWWTLDALMVSYAAYFLAPLALVWGVVCLVLLATTVGGPRTALVPGAIWLEHLTRIVALVVLAPMPLALTEVLFRSQEPGREQPSVGLGATSLGAWALYAATRRRGTGAGWSVGVTGAVLAGVALIASHAWRPWVQNDQPPFNLWPGFYLPCGVVLFVLGLHLMTRAYGSPLAQEHGVGSRDEQGRR